jgi:hypothetical protein
MAVRKPLVNLATKQAICRDYALGKGSIRSLAKTYHVSKETICAWIAAEKWGDVRDMFARNDDLIVAKRQIVILDGFIEQESEPEAMMYWVRCKTSLFEILATIAGLPRRPIGKLEKPKRVELDALLNAASENVPRGTIEVENNALSPNPPETKPATTHETPANIESK